MLEGIDPKTLRTWLIVAAIAYLLLPYDLIPDFLGLPGRADDLGLMAFLAWFYRDHLRKHSASRTGNPDAKTRSGASRAAGADADRRRPGRFDPREVLGVAASASSDEIRAAYRARMQEYHPDRVAHLGDELQQLAHEKAQEIQRAYQLLRP